MHENNKLILIADSGSTKTTWYLTNSKNNGEVYKTIGFNPHYYSPKQLEDGLKKALEPIIGKTIEHVYFYGAGCSTPRECQKIKTAIGKIFPSSGIDVMHDLLAAARALCGHDKGIACILGTGSNSCLYDGNDIIDNIAALGFTLGDHGAGSSIGRALIQAYFYREMPADIHDIFEAEYNPSKETLFAEVYGGQFPNRYMASFAPFAVTHQKHPFIHQLVLDLFSDFVRRQVLKYDNAKEYPIHFIGSIASMLKDILSQALKQDQLHLGKIIRDPIKELAAFHLSGKIATKKSH